MDYTFINLQCEYTIQHYLHYTTLTRANGIIIFINNTKSTFKLLGNQKQKYKKENPFILVNGETISFDKDFEVIEINVGDNELKYFAIGKIAEMKRFKKYKS